jgi:hypothetical protein
MRPPKRSNKDYEKVKIGEMISGVIEEVQYDMEHKFKGFQGKEDTIQPAVRLKFMLDGYKFPHFSRWMKFSLGEKANLYKKYVSKLIENAEPDMDVDIDALKGMRVKTVWSEDRDFQNIDAIYPEGAKAKRIDASVESVPEIHIDEEPPIDEESAPF